VFQQVVIEVFTTQVSISGSGFHREDTACDVQQWNIEGSSTKIKDKNIFFCLTLLIKTIGDGCGSWLVDDTQNIQPGDGPGILSSKTLRIVEIGWNTGIIWVRRPKDNYFNLRDNSFLDGLAQFGFRDLLHLI
jgi:hypothetical protein